jgi:hypothetical protein
MIMWITKSLLAVNYVTKEFFGNKNKSCELMTTTYELLRFI